MQQDLTLYQYNACPFCRRVTQFMRENNIEIPMRDTLRDPQARQDLRAAGGKSQVPALMIDGQVLYESNDIIAWMKRNLLTASAAEPAA